GVRSKRLRDNVLENLVSKVHRLLRAASLLHTVSDVVAVVDTDGKLRHRLVLFGTIPRGVQGSRPVVILPVTPCETFVAGSQAHTLLEAPNGTTHRSHKADAIPLTSVGKDTFYLHSPDEGSHTI